MLLTALQTYALAIAVSLGVAALIRAIVVVLGALDRVRGQSPAAEPPAVATSDGAVPPAHLAAIAAAVHATLGAHRIVHIHDAHRHEGWVAEGRRAQHHTRGPAHHPHR
ncbi:MAG TPA: hypothetical protein PLX20_06420 [Rhodocyclaceae bacterium]|mgnify:CR=1 FL=1|nr:hypothetical protein [Rhodocyclaceae bacterium]HNA03681.1 hypothetical protein [Rhodocyclaceae bacterium]HNH12748.1 hypothetical protein [Rhodocyclaceae bacterium]